MTDRAALALRALARRPVAQDAAVAAGLLVACAVVNDPVGLLHGTGGQTVDGGWSGPWVAWSWWAATAGIMIGVTLRRSRPVPMLVLCTLMTAAHLAGGVPFTVPDLAVPILLYTVAARHPRTVSLPALAGLLLVSAAWWGYGSHSEGSLPLPHLQECRRVDSISGPQHVGSVHSTCRSSGSATWSALPVLGSCLTAAWAIGSGGRNRRAYLRELHARAQDLARERDQQAALAVAAERGRIGSEVHDVVAHGLSLIVIQAQGAEAALDNHPEDTRRALRTIVKTGRDSLADMRRVLGALGQIEDAWHPQPGLAELPALVARVQHVGTPVRLRVLGDSAALPSAVDLAAYRIVQEALTNVMKHAGTGASADVVVSYRGSDVDIEISDDGRGGTADGDGNGLRGMHRRVALLGGELSAGPGADRGFAVRASLPIAGREP